MGFMPRDKPSFKPRRQDQIATKDVASVLRLESALIVMTDSF